MPTALSIRNKIAAILSGSSFRENSTLEKRQPKLTHDERSVLLKVESAFSLLRKKRAKNNVSRTTRQRN